MGVEWNIGCLKCKRQIWLGSQKPFNWKGFQIGDESVKRFLSLHALCNNQVDGNLLLTNDETTKVPWEDNEERLEWNEDILSRTFCFDSLNSEGIICAYCSEKLEVDEESRKRKGNLKKNQFLWFCNEACFDNYIEYNRKDRGRFIYDSTKDQLPQIKQDSFEAGCINCKSYIVINKQKDTKGKTRDIEYFALFLCEHLGHDHLLKINIGNNNIPWRETKLHNEWKEYEY